MSYQQRRGAGSGNPSGGGGPYRNNKRSNNRNNQRGNRNNQQFSAADGEVDWRSNGNGAGGGGSSAGESDSTGVFNSAEEGSLGSPGGGNNTVVIESSEEEVEEPASVVNASLIVNLSNANVSQVSFVEAEGERGDLTGGGGDSNVSSETLVGVSPVEEVKEIVMEEESDVAGSKVEVDDEEDDDVVIIEEKIVVQDASSPRKIKVERLSPPPPGEKKKTGGVCQGAPPPDIVLHAPPASLPSSPGRLDVPPVSASTLSNSSEESNLADSEVEKLMSGGSGGGGGFEAAALPGTVTVLQAPNGVRVFLVGTAHFSHQSHVDVVNTIQQTNPTLVLLELCSSRRNILSLDEETVLKEVSEMNFQKVRLALSNSGAVQGVLHLLLLSMSAQLTRKLGMAPGGEFRAAMREARKIPGCVLLLGDRPFNITISRALAALTFFQKIKLGWQFLTSNEDITKEEIERCKEMDAISMLLKEMTGEFPTITEVFVNERDVFLAHSLFLAATSEAHGSTGRDRVVVGVVGMGHVPGIVRNWGKTTDESVNQLLRIPETPISSIIIRKSIKFCWYGLLGYGLYRLGKRIGATNHVNIDLGKIIGERVIAVKSLLKPV